MSKFFKALEEAERDRALKSAHRGEVVSPDFPPDAVPTLRVDDAQVPVDSTDIADVDEHLVSLVTPAAFEAEQYRALRHNIERLHKATGLQVVAVSSPCAGDGKTVTAVNLAGALAQAVEARVLLIDGDLRHPSVSGLLGLPASDHRNLVAAILDPRIDLDQIVQVRSPFNLSIIGAGPTPAAPYEILKSPRLGELLGRARERYDYIVVDTPPLVPVQDCRVIGRWVDGFLVVVAALRTQRRFVEESLTMLDRAKILGFVFNEEDEPIASHYAGSYYAYTASAMSGARRRRPLREALNSVGGSLWRDHGAYRSKTDARPRS